MVNTNGWETMYEGWVNGREWEDWGWGARWYVERGRGDRVREGVGDLTYFHRSKQPLRTL
jgi:hypothetical protein